MHHLALNTSLPSYVSALLGGFKEALEKGHVIPWPKALELAAFAVKRADEVEREAVGSDAVRE